MTIGRICRSSASMAAGCPFAAKIVRSLIVAWLAPVMS
jgi:hypothetical protein